MDRVRGAGLALLAADGAGDEVLGELDGDHAGRAARVGDGKRGLGPEPDVRAACDVVVRVPIYGKAESLNLAMAATLCLYESARRQRKAPLIG